MAMARSISGSDSGSEPERALTGWAKWTHGMLYHHFSPTSNGASLQSACGTFVLHTVRNMVMMNTAPDEKMQCPMCRVKLKAEH